MYGIWTHNVARLCIYRATSTTTLEEGIILLYYYTMVMLGVIGITDTHGSVRTALNSICFRINTPYDYNVFGHYIISSMKINFFLSIQVILHD